MPSSFKYPSVLCVPVAEYVAGRTFYSCKN